MDRFPLLVDALEVLVVRFLLVGSHQLQLAVEDAHLVELLGQVADELARRAVLQPDARAEDHFRLVGRLVGCVVGVGGTGIVEGRGRGRGWGYLMSEV